MGQKGEGCVIFCVINIESGITLAHLIKYDTLIICFEGYRYYLTLQQNVMGLGKKKVKLATS